MPIAHFSRIIYPTGHACTAVQLERFTIHEFIPFLLVLHTFVMNELVWNIKGDISVIGKEIMYDKTGRGERSAGWIFAQTRVYTGWILKPTGVSNFHRNYPKWVVKFENCTNISQRVWLKTKKRYQTGVCLTFEDPARGCTWDEKGDVKCGTSLLTLTEGMPRWTSRAYTEGYLNG